jgi:DNA-binding transcriptional MocR family regulator
MDELLYSMVSSQLKQKIESRTYDFGEKLPSLREICEQFNVSMSTALSAFRNLEDHGLISPKSKSGYFVTYMPHPILPTPSPSKPILQPSQRHASDIVQAIFNDLGNETAGFALGVPSKEMLPTTKLNKALHKAIKGSSDRGIQYESVQGNSLLRRNIARRSQASTGKITPDDIIITSGCTEAISVCLLALTQPGDTIVVESPSYFGTLQLAKQLKLHVLELPTNPVTGIEIDALKQVVRQKKVKACILVSNFSNPLGSCMPDEHKKAVVSLMEQYQVPLIEDDIYGDLYFGGKRPVTCKSFDVSGIVLWCGSFSKTVAPGFRLGWVAPGKFFQEVYRAKLYHSLGSTAITQQAMASFLEEGRYETHLRAMRNSLADNSKRFIAAISESFPYHTKLTSPQGGYMLWVELSKSTDTLELFKNAARNKITFSPGHVFTLRKQYLNCLRLSFAMSWTEKIAADLKLLGKMAARKKG